MLIIIIIILKQNVLEQISEINDTAQDGHVVIHSRLKTHQFCNLNIFCTPPHRDAIIIC